MNTLILTGWAGDTYGEMASHTVPLMQAYAQRHGHAFASWQLVDDGSASWQKVPFLSFALETYERVAWIDVDVVIRNADRDIIAELQPDHWQALVEHHTECGTVPNCGVWVVSRAMLPVLADAWQMRGELLRHPWWEQAAILRLMGYAVTNQPAATLGEPTELHRRTTFLGSEWNDHPADRRRSPDRRFIHATQNADRLAAIKEALP